MLAVNYIYHGRLFNQEGHGYGSFQFHYSTSHFHKQPFFLHELLPWVDMPCNNRAQLASFTHVLKYSAHVSVLFASLRCYRLGINLSNVILFDAHSVGSRLLYSPLVCPRILKVALLSYAQTGGKIYTVECSRWILSPMKGESSGCYTAALQLTKSESRGLFR